MAPWGSHQEASKSPSAQNTRKGVPPHSSTFVENVLPQAVAIPKRAAIYCTLVVRVWLLANISDRAPVSTACRPHSKSCRRCALLVSTLGPSLRDLGGGVSVRLRDLAGASPSLSAQILTGPVIGPL